MFIENYEKYACDFIFQSKDAKLRDVNVKPKYKTEDKAIKGNRSNLYLHEIHYFITKRSMYDLVWTQMQYKHFVIFNKPFFNLQ